ncbi:hypothetical protein [Sulfurimonas sp.]|uniref:hypothetical protein n=1 Tax=Sulfurimonas sp. TaxID=2022749 RepID=UPI002633CC93|nr:hypothetical protein [Sulfurimonas sp.]
MALPFELLEALGLTAQQSNIFITNVVLIYLSDKRLHSNMENVSEIYQFND